jgi:hypothetical protein
MEGEFFQRFCLSTATVELRCPTNRNYALLPVDQLLVALRFYATGSFLSVAGDFGGIHKTTTGKLLLV